MQHDKKTPHRLELNTLDYWLHKEIYCRLKGESKTLDIDFGVNPETLKLNYLDLYEDIHAEMVYTNRFDENSDLSTTYLRPDKNDKGHENQSRRKIPHYQTGFHLRKIIGMVLAVKLC